jgi:carboxypeptidase family protein
MTRALIVLLVSTLIAPPASIASSSGALEGRVVSGKGNAAPTAVWVATAARPQEPQRTAVGENGSFRIDDVPAGTVELAVETADGMYLVDTPITLAPGATRQVQLALRGRENNPPPTPAPHKKTGTLWDNPLTATLIVVGGAVVTGLIIDAVDDDDGDNVPNASPSNP